LFFIAYILQDIFTCAPTKEKLFLVNTKKVQPEIEQHRLDQPSS